MMQIRRVNRSAAATKPPTPVPALDRLRRWAQTPSGCRTCDKARAALGRALPPVRR